MTPGKESRLSLAARIVIVAVAGLATISPLYWMVVVAFSSRSELLGGRELRLWPRELSGHATATQLLERLRAQSARHQFRLAFAPGRAARSAPEHIAIIDAVIAGDADAAEAATRTHLAGIVEVLRTLD